MRIHHALIAVVFLLSSTAAAEENVTALPVASEQFGTNVLQKLIPVQAFVKLQGDPSLVATGITSGYYTSTGGDFQMWAPLSVDVGVAVDEICLEVFDNDDLEEVEVRLIGAESGNASNPNPAVRLLAVARTGIAQTPGYTQICVAAVTSPFPLTVRTTGNLDGNGTTSTIQYYLLTQLPATRVPNAVMSGAAVVKYRRINSRAPFVSTFTDVPFSHPFYQFIEALAASGITQGCTATEYCPDATVTRGQMAAFLARALGLHFPN